MGILYLKIWSLLVALTTGAFFNVIAFRLVRNVGCLECKFNLLFTRVTFDKKNMRIGWSLVLFTIRKVIFEHIDISNN